MAITAAQKVETGSTTPQPKVIETKVEGDLNTTAVQATGPQPNSIHTEVKGAGNTTIVTVNNYNKTYGSSSGTSTGKTSESHKTQQKQAESPKKTEPKKTPETKPEAKPAPTQAPISARETEQRAKQLAHASNGPGTRKEEFYNALTTVPGGETTTSSSTGDTRTMDQRVFLSKDNLVKIDKYLKTHQLATYASPMAKAGGIRNYIMSENFNIKDRNDFYNNKMRELVNLLDKYGIK